jgi:hypothetical protein
VYVDRGSIPKGKGELRSLVSDVPRGVALVAGGGVGMPWDMSMKERGWVS